MSANRRQFLGAIGGVLAAIGFSPKEATSPKKGDRFARHPPQRTALTGASYIYSLSGNPTVLWPIVSHRSDCPTLKMAYPCSPAQQERFCECRPAEPTLYFVPGGSV